MYLFLFPPPGIFSGGGKGENGSDEAGLIGGTKNGSADIDYTGGAGSITIYCTGFYTEGGSANIYYRSSGVYYGGKEVIYIVGVGFTCC